MLAALQGGCEWDSRAGDCQYRRKKMVTPIKTTSGQKNVAHLTLGDK